MLVLAVVADVVSLLLSPQVTVVVDCPCARCASILISRRQQELLRPHIGGRGPSELSNFGLNGHQAQSEWSPLSKCVLRRLGTWPRGHTAGGDENDMLLATHVGPGISCASV